MDAVLTLTDGPTPEQQRVIDSGLARFNAEQAGYSLRGQQLGSRVLAAAEDEARRRGCSAAMLYTISFQAPGFYEGQGYRAFGTIACDPPGTSRVFMTKSLK